MAHRVTAVVHDPETDKTVLVETEVDMWYGALDMVCLQLGEIDARYKEIGVNHLVIRAITIMHVPD